MDCQAKNVRGTKCKMKAIEGSIFCHQHPDYLIKLKGRLKKMKKEIALLEKIAKKS